jgi:hypothetical protein
MARPTVGADARRGEQLKPLARQTTRGSGLALTLCRFAIRTALERFHP